MGCATHPRRRSKAQAPGQQSRPRTSRRWATWPAPFSGNKAAGRHDCSLTRAAAGEGGQARVESDPSEAASGVTLKSGGKLRVGKEGKAAQHAWHARSLSMARNLLSMVKGCRRVCN